MRPRVYVRVKGNVELAESKVHQREIYQPNATTIEAHPTILSMFHDHPRVMLKPHWHAQVEVNFIVAGTVHYRMMA